MGAQCQKQEGRSERFFLKRTALWTKLFGNFLLIFGVIFWPTFWSLFGPLLGTILGPTLGPDRPKGGQDEPKRVIRSFKEPKSCIFKNLKKPQVFEGFWVRRPSKRASRDPRRLPRGTQRAPNPQQKDPKLSPKINNFLINFGQIFGIKNAQKITQEKPTIKKQIKQMNLYKTQVDTTA